MIVGSLVLWPPPPGRVPRACTAGRQSRVSSLAVPRALPTHEHDRHGKFKPRSGAHCSAGMLGARTRTHARPLIPITHGGLAELRLW